MSKVTTDVVSAVQMADTISCVISPGVCMDCEDVCYWITMTARVQLGESSAATTCFHKRHTTLSDALAMAGMMHSSIASKIRKREAAAWLLEHQGQLFD
jgi:hypothetical protein